MLKDALYHIFVYPLESLLGFILSLLQGYCGSYGLSIILLSLLVNLLLLKLFFLADRASKNHALIKSKLDIKIAEFKRVFKGGELYAYIKTLYRQNHYHPIYALKTLGGLALQVPFFVAVVSLLEFHSPELKGVGFGVIPDLLSPDGLLGGINLLPLLMTFFTLCNVWISSNERGARIQGAVIALIFLVLLYKMPSALLLYWTTSVAFALLKSVCVKYIQLPHKEEKESKKESQTFFSKIFNACFTKYSDLSPQDYKLYRNISIFAILNLCVLIFLYNPFALYASDVSQFDPKETWNTLGALFGFFLLTAFLLIYGTSFFYKTRLLKLGVYGFCVMLMIALVYNFVLDYNVFEGKPYPSMDGLLFKGEGANISHPKAIYFDCMMGFIMMLFAVIVFYHKIASKFYVAIRGFFIAFNLLALWSFISIAYSQDGVKPLVIKEKSSEKSSTQDNHIMQALNFSKKEKNLLLIISDTVQSDNFAAAINQYPQIKKVFDGFVYYPNSVSVSSVTFTSVPAIIGGTYYHPLKISKRIDEGKAKSFAGEALEAFDNVISSFQKDGYHIAIGASYPANYQDMKKKFENMDNVYIYDALYEQRTIENLIEKKLKNTKNSNVGDLISIGLFRVSSYTLRSRVYQSGGWIFGSSLYGNHLRLSLQNTTRLRDLTKYLSATNEMKTFKIIHENSDHFPWMMDRNSACLPMNGDKYQKKMVFERDNLAYENHLCYLQNLSRLFQWMKDNNVFDNTKIVIVSDHGNGGYGAEVDIEYPIRQARYSHSLLLIKDFGAKNNLQIDKQALVSNADAMLPLCEILDNGCKKIDKTFIRATKTPRDVLFAFTQKVEKDLPIYGFIYEVKNSIYDLKNWKDVTKEFLDNLNKKEEKK